MEPSPIKEMARNIAEILKSKEHETTTTSQSNGNASTSIKAALRSQKAGKKGVHKKSGESVSIDIFNKVPILAFPTTGSV